MKVINYKGLNFLIDGLYYKAEKGDYITNGSPELFEINKIYFVMKDSTCDFTEFFENDMDEIETLILNQYYEN